MGGLKLQDTSGKRSRTDIPQEIIMEIMYRLPASSVGKFRIVSKEWRSLLSEPSFIKTHQVINTLNRNHHILIFKPIAASTASLFLIPFRENQPIEKARPPKNYAPFGDASDDELDVIGCCNGLVLLSAFSVSDDDGGLTIFDHRLIVLNPTTRDFLELPSPNCCFDGDGSHITQFKKCFLYGFCYDSFTDDYKVVTIFYDYYVPTVSTVHVYSLRTKVWRHLTDFPYNPVHTWMNSSNAFINGNIHRLAKKGSDNEPKNIIVAFSLADETISEVPSLDDYIMRLGPCKLVDVGGKLGIFRELEGEVWLMNEYGVKESWTKILFQEIPRGVDRRLTLIHKDDGKILVVYRDLKLIYTLDEKGLRKYCDAKSQLWTDLIPKAICVESLVSLNDYGQVNQLARIFDNPS